MSHRPPKQNGFTIIEIVIVICVISILATLLVLPNLFATQAIRRDNDRKRELGYAHQQLETYFNTNGRYPDTLDAVVANADGRQDPRNEPYAYSVSDNKQSYTLVAKLENTHDPKADANGMYSIQSVNQQ